MQTLSSIRRGMDRTVDLICIALLVAMVVVVVAQVIWRYLLGAALPWSEELARFLFIWITFLGASIASRRAAHIGMDSLVKLLNPRWQRYAGIAGDLVVALFLVVMVVSGWGLTKATTDQPSPALDLSMSWVYLSIPLGGIAMLVVLLGDIGAKIRWSAARVTLARREATRRDP